MKNVQTALIVYLPSHPGCPDLVGRRGLQDQEGQTLPVRTQISHDTDIYFGRLHYTLGSVFIDCASAMENKCQQILIF